MKITPNWIWKIYFLAYLFFTLKTTISFFSADSEMHSYYHILIAYHPYFLILYFLNLCSIALNIFSCLAFYFFLYDIPFLSSQFWKWIFLFRGVMDILGRSYEFKFLQSLFYDDPYIFLFVLAPILFIIVPSYIALYQYYSYTNKR